MTSSQEYGFIVGEPVSLYLPNLSFYGYSFDVNYYATPSYTYPSAPAIQPIYSPSAAPTVPLASPISYAPVYLTPTLFVSPTPIADIAPPIYAQTGSYNLAQQPLDTYVPVFAPIIEAPSLPQASVLQSSYNPTNQSYSYSEIGSVSSGGYTFLVFIAESLAPIAAPSIQPIYNAPGIAYAIPQIAAPPINPSAGLGTDANATNVSSSGVAFIQNAEGFTATPKLDPNTGLYEIGYGTEVSASQAQQFQNGISQSDAQSLLNSTVQTISNQINNLVTVPLTQNQFDALTSLIYNVGIGSFQNSQLLQDLNNGNYSAAANEFLNGWDTIDGTYSQGLANRRASEYALFNNASNSTSLSVFQPSAPLQPIYAPSTTQYPPLAVLQPTASLTPIYAAPINNIYETPNLPYYIPQISAPPIEPIVTSFTPTYAPTYRQHGAGGGGAGPSGGGSGSRSGGSGQGGSQTPAQPGRGPNAPSNLPIVAPILPTVISPITNSNVPSVQIYLPKAGGPIYTPPHIQPGLHVSAKFTPMEWGIIGIVALMLLSKK